MLFLTDEWVLIEKIALSDKKNFNIQIPGWSLNPSL